MAVYFAFYDNMGKGVVVPVAFKSESKANSFIEDFEYYGDFKQFNYDYIGDSRTFFIKYLDEHGASAGRGFSVRKEIVNYDGVKLFKYLMSMFERKIKR